MPDIMKKLIDQKEALKPPRIGQIVQGKVINVEKAAIFLDLGAQGTGIIYDYFS